MFIGHYAAAFAIRSHRKAPPLWVLFLGAQFIDVIWALLVLGGVEQVRIVPGLMEASDLDLVHMPVSHSLIGVVIWSALAGLLWSMFAPGREPQRTAGWLLAVVVASHWVLDVIVHRPDLPIFGEGLKVGLGLWNHLWLSQALEVGLLVLGFALWIRATRSVPPPASPWLRAAPYLLLAGMVALQAAQHAPGLAPASPASLVSQALVLYFALAVLAGITDRARLHGPVTGAPA